MAEEAVGLSGVAKVAVMDGLEWEIQYAQPVQLEVVQAAYFHSATCLKKNKKNNHNLIPAS